MRLTAEAEGTLIDLGDGRQLDAAKGSKPAYPRWPDLRGGAFDSYSAALLCAEVLRGAMVADDAAALWVTPFWAAEYTGLGQRLIDMRVRARLQGVEVAWPWTRVRDDRCVFLPDLWEEAIWVTYSHARAYLGLGEVAFAAMLKRGLLSGSYRPFRGIDRDHLRAGLAPRNNAVYLPDLVRCRQLVQLRRLFGTRFSYGQLETMVDLSPQTVARIKAGKMLSSNMLGSDHE
jgi:hypothetical protein